MRIFVTGASGWIGSAVVPELIDAGHEVVALARSDASAAALSGVGALVERGDLDDLEVLGEAAAASDGVIHLAFKHELAFGGDFMGAASADRRAVEAMGQALLGSDRPFVVASGILGISPGALATERDGHDLDANRSRFGEGPLARWATSEFVLSLSEQAVRSAIVRLPPTNHGDGDNGFMATLVTIARDSGIAGYIGDGSNRWPAVHRSDSARLFRLAVEESAPGSTWHAVADEGVAIRDIAEVLGRHLDVPLVSVAPDDAAAHFTWLANFLALDSPASSEETRRLLGWEPSGPGLLFDLDAGHYFSKPTTHTAEAMTP